ncbi:MAG: DUF3810 family protein [Acidobacteria bacterium]|nr:DUF3810 family protein [Acidobacteriota bacterium]
MRRISIIVIAICAGMAPFPPELIEDRYSRAIYPHVQHVLTSFSNSTTIALFDVALALGAFVALVLLVRRGRVLNLLCFIAIAWMVFLATWGLNYRRSPVEDRPEHDRARVTPANVVAMARRAVTEMNRLHGQVQGTPAPDLETLARSLAPAMDRAALTLDLAPPLPARPKQTWLAPYFVRAGIDGMTDPFFLETLLAPTLLDVEQPAALAHEWGHLAGLANEAEAGFFGWLTCMRGDARAQYSGWLALYPHLLGAIPERERKSVQIRLAAGPKYDCRRIAERVAQSDERVRAAAHTTYDTFLRANRVEEGVDSYGAVVRLVVGMQIPVDPARR